MWHRATTVRRRDIMIRRLDTIAWRIIRDPNFGKTDHLTITIVQTNGGRFQAIGGSMQVRSWSPAKPSSVPSTRSAVGKGRPAPTDKHQQERDRARLAFHHDHIDEEGKADEQHNQGKKHSGPRTHATGCCAAFRNSAAAADQRAMKKALM
jgi:hypothetical protein